MILRLILPRIRRRVPDAARAERAPRPAKGLLQPLPATSLLAAPRRRKLLAHIWQRTSVSRQQFDALYLAPIHRYAELVQQLPASESHHHAWLGGMLDHGLEIVAYALKLRQSHLLPAGVTPEEQAAQADVWTAGVAYAALLHDIGKIAVDVEVRHADGSVWHPWHGPLRQAYRFRYREAREYRLHGAAAGLMYTRVLDPAIMDWLSSHAGLWSALLYVLAGQYEHAGLLGELVTSADRASVSHALGGDPGRAVAAPRDSLQRKLLDGLRYLVQRELKINQPQASDGWLTENALWLVSKTVSDKLRAHLLAQGMAGIPSSNTAVFDVLQDHGIAQATPEGKAIWRATVVAGNGWSNSFTFLRLSPALIWEPGERPEPFAGTVEPVDVDEGAAASVQTGPESSGGKGEVASVVPRIHGDAGADHIAVHDLLDELLPAAALGNGKELRAAIASSPEAAPATASGTDAEGASAARTPSPTFPEDDASPSGEHFVNWLRHGVQSRALIINDARALVHTVAGTAYIVSPGIFQRYVQEHPAVAALARQDDLPPWQWVQKRFERLHLHRKQPNGLNIWTCEVRGPRKTRRLHGYLLDDPVPVFAQEAVADNPYLTLQAPAASR